MIETAYGHALKLWIEQSMNAAVAAAEPEPARSL